MIVQLVGMSSMDSSLGRGYGGGTRCVDCQSLKCGVTIPGILPTSSSIAQGRPRSRTLPPRSTLFFQQWVCTLRTACRVELARSMSRYSLPEYMCRERASGSSASGPTVWWVALHRYFLLFFGLCLGRVVVEVAWLWSFLRELIRATVSGSSSSVLAGTKDTRYIS